MAKDPFAIPTPEQILRQAVPREVRNLMGGTAGTPGADRRKRPRVTIDELTEGGAEAVRKKWPDLPDQLEGMEKEAEGRSSIEKAFDWIDLPRNVVGNIIGAIIGVDTSKAPRAALGLRQVRMSDILGKLGVPEGAVRSVVGFVGDILIDPLTYLTAGASTGAKAGRTGVRLMKPAVAALKNVLRVGAKTAPDTLQAALKGIDLAKQTWRTLGEQVVRRAMTLGDDIGNAARKWLLAPGHVLEGRKVLRIPFTQIAGPTIRHGRAARAFKALGEVTPEAAKAMRVVPAATATAARASERLRGLERMAERAVDPDQAGKIQKMVSAAGKTRTEAESMAMRFSEQLPEVSRLAKRGELGYGVDPTKNPVRYALTRVFGNLFGSSPFHQRELSLTGAATIGASNAERAMAAKLRPLVDKVAQKLVANKTAPDMKAAWRLMRDVLDLGDEAAVKALYPGGLGPAEDAGRVVWRRFGPLLNADPDFVKLRNTVRAQATRWEREAARYGIEHGLVEGAYVPRVTMKEAGKAIRGQRGLSQAGGRRPAGLAGAPFQATRARYYEAAAEGLEPKLVLATADDVAGKLDEGYKLTGRSWPVSAAEQEAIAADPKRYESLFGRGVDREAIRKAGLFEPDIAAAMGQRARQQERAVAMSKMQKLVNEQAVVVTPETSKYLGPAQYRYVEPLKPDNPLSDILGPQTPFGAEGRRLAYPFPVADALDRLRDTFKNPGEMAYLLKPFDHTLSWFKRWALFAPAYVTRNIFQNSFGTLMAGANPYRQAVWTTSDAAKQMMKAVTTNSIDALQGFVRVGSRRMSLRELVQAFVDYNGAMAGKSIAEFTPDLLRGGGQLKKVLRMTGKTGRSASEVFRNLNAIVETRMRFGTYMAFVEKGFGSREAMMRTLLAMPDLSDLTAIERNTFARIFPWFRWLRRNGALQVAHFLPESPEFMAAAQRFPKALEEFSSLWREDAENVPDELRPEWMREAGAGQVGGTDKAGLIAVLNNWFPFEDVQTLVASTREPGEGLRRMASQARPGLKFVAEMATGQDIFRRRPIEKLTMADMVTGAPAALVGASGTPLDQLLNIRPARELGKRIWEQPSAAGKVARVFAGGMMQPVDAEQGLQALDWQTQKSIAEIRRLIARAKEAGETSELKSLEKLLAKWLSLHRRRQRLGLKVSPRVSAALSQGQWAAQPEYE